MGRAETLAMLAAGQVPERYLRNIGTIGAAGQARLLEAKVAVVGAGGLGGTIVELLARQGIGYLKVIDGDAFAAHNLNRQLLAAENNLGANKAIAAAARVAAINSDVAVDAVPRMLDADNAAGLLAGIDIVVDALDNIATRLLLGQTARDLGIPLVHGAIAGFTGQIATILPGDPGLDRIYKLCAGQAKGIENALGNPAATPALAASLQVQEVVKLLTGVGRPLSRQLLYFDTELNLFEIFTLG
ncbi:MAG: HesA/MoeB/ThiF family protein [Sporomusaceae bacterium]|nr:HesA/MoeB/ThiF family protein [Sporomusaceae bacterium]